mgnify:CR=1 FL=1
MRLAPFAGAHVLVALDDAPNVRLIGTLPGAPELHAGQPMRVVFDDDAKARRTDVIWMAWYRLFRTRDEPSSTCVLPCAGAVPLRRAAAGA